MADWTVFRWKGRLGPLELHVSSTTFAPSTISGLVADALVIDEENVVIDVGCGCGVLGLIAARLGARSVHATDRASDVVEIGRANAAELGVADRITFYRGDLFESIPREIKADVVIGDVSGIPDELAAESGWFPGRAGGGPRGSELPIRMLEQARGRLHPFGRLFLPTGSLQDEASILDAARSLYGSVKKVADRVIPLPSALAESDVVQRLRDGGVIEIFPKGSRWVWEARVWELKPQS